MEERTRLFFYEKTASMSCSFMIDASGSSRLSLSPMLFMDLPEERPLDHNFRLFLTMYP